MGSRGKTRRYVLSAGVRVATAASLGGLLAALGLPPPARGQDWRSLFRSAPTGGDGTVKKLAGEAWAAGRPLAEGARVASGEEVRVAPEGWCILSLSDRTILRINGNTTVRLTVGRERRGLFQLLAGSLLTVVPEGNRYLVQMPTATIGIKGTVFFHQIYHPGERTARDAKGREVTIPEGIGEYFCLCNGLADFLRVDAGEPFYTEEATYHDSFYLDPRRAEPLVKAPQLNHTDMEIRGLIDLQEGPKHPVDWLKAYESGYDDRTEYDNTD